jgi:CheY-like chemotaxis protein
MHVLVADDDRLGSLILGETLRRWSLEVTVVADGDAAWRHLQTSTVPTLAILDWVMPGVDGAEVCRRVRRDMPLANMYLVLLTSLEGRSHIIAGLDAGADDYLVKPFDPDELRARINVGARVLSLQEKLADRVAELQAALDNVKQLHGLLPICSYCKRIRNDGQYWQQVESYISERSHVQFSHSICPSCYSRLEKDLAIDDAQAIDSPDGHRSP